MSCSISDNIYPKFDDLKAYIDGHYIHYVDRYPFDTSDLVTMFSVVRKIQVINFPESLAEDLAPYVDYANCIVKQHLDNQGANQADRGAATETTAIDSAEAPVEEAAPVEPVEETPAAPEREEIDSGLEPSQYAVPNLYTLRSEDDFYRAFWVAEGNSFSTYNRAEAEKRFITYVNEEIQKLYSAVSGAQVDPPVDSLVGQFRDGLESPYFSSPDDAIDLLTQVQALVYSKAPSEDIERVLGYIYAQQFAEMAEENDGILPDYAYENYNPNLKTEDFISTQGGEKNLRGDWQRAVDDILAVKAFSENFPLASEVPAPDAPLEEWAAYVNQLSEDYLLWLKTYKFTPDELESYDGDVMAEASLAAHETSAEGYEAAAAWDMIRQVVYDPSWSPAQERKQLGELMRQIHLLPREILGVDVGFVRQGLLDYYYLMLSFHNWRVKIKSVVDEVETRLMSQATPGEEFGQALFGVLTTGGILLSIFFEPLDWIMSIADILRGDISGALFNLLPLVPGAIGKLGRFVGKAAGDAAEYAGVITRLDEAGEALEGLDEAKELAKAEGLSDLITPRIPRETSLPLQSQWVVANRSRLDERFNTNFQDLARASCVPASLNMVLSDPNLVFSAYGRSLIETFGDFDGFRYESHGIYRMFQWGDGVEVVGRDRIGRLIFNDVPLGVTMPDAANYLTNMLDQNLYPVTYRTIFDGDQITADLLLSKTGIDRPGILRVSADITSDVADGHAIVLDYVTRLNGQNGLFAAIRDPALLDFDFNHALAFTDSSKLARGTSYYFDINKLLKYTTGFISLSG